MSDWQPLEFEPVFREYLWGGRRLGELLGKPIGAGPSYAESWEVVDHGADQSVVAEGPLAGRTLHELVVEHGEELLGATQLATASQLGRFPLLFKFLDARLPLSLQVHPNDEQASRLDPPDLGKTEAWVVLAAEPEAVIYAGLRQGVTRPQLAEALAGQGEQRPVDCMHQLQARAGDCIFIPAGTPHALGAGLLIAEIQQASNTTFRMYDWDRVGSDGRPRPLHLKQALEAIEFPARPVEPQVPQPLADGRERLVECDRFVLDRIRLTSGVRLTAGGDGRFRILSVVSGQAEVWWGEQRRTLGLGRTTLVPAVLEVELTGEDAVLAVLEVELTGEDAVLLEMTTP